MARASRAVAEQHKATIEEVSARLFREHGLHGVSVAKVMADAGLTHGGFYGHFASKDELVARACALAFDESAEHWRHRIDRAHGDRQAARHSLVDQYLTTAHRDAAGRGCAASALTGDVAREASDKPVHATYLQGIKTLIDLWKSTAPDDNDTEDDGAAHGTALAEVAMLVGAITMARATRADALSGEILDAVRATLLARADASETVGA
jgi:TetR/AcrR family transcriptional repressor of nem operon